MKKLYLVDVSSMYFRAFYAIRPLSNEAGMPTNALYGFLSMTTKLLKQVKPDYLAFCFDNKEPSFRKEIYPEYKANRSEMPEDLVPQVPYVRKISEVLGIPVFNQIGYEADDLIGSLTHFGRENDLDVRIVSGDKDFAQLIGPYVSMHDTMKDIQYDVQGVVDKWGVSPEQFIDYLALVGDASDNIPGVKGIGPKGAQKLLAQYKTLQGIYDSIDEVKPPGTKKKLEESKEMAFLSQKLVTIECGVEIASDINELRMKEINRSDLQELLAELGFKSFEKNLLGVVSDNKEDNKEEKSEKNTEIKAQKESSEKEKPTDWSFVEKTVTVEELSQCFSEGDEVWGVLTERGLYLSTNREKENEVYTVQGDLLAAGEVLSEKKLKWLGHDLKSFWGQLKIKSPVATWDQMLASYVIKPGAAESFEDMYNRYTGGKAPELPTSGQFVECHFRLKQSLQKLLKEKDESNVFEKLELPLSTVLYEMENEGIAVDLEELKDQSQGLSKDIKSLEEKIFEEAGETFNVASTKQLSQILFEKMEIPPIKKTKTGYSTDGDVLEKLSAEYPIAEYLIEFRELSKLKSTYVDSLPQLVNKETGRIHTHFNQAHTATGRLSSHDPNLQNIPIRTPRGNRVRRAFVAAPGKTLLSIDYSQIELRILAHITEDEGLCEAFANDLDIHAATASQIYATPLEEVTSEQRRNAKAVNFGIAYGQGPFGLAENLGISRKEASGIIGQYFAKFSRVKDYMIDVVETGKKQGYVETIFGRRRYLEELNSKNGRLRQFGERAAINAPVQGAASDIVKKAMIEVHQQKISGLLLQVHDELLFEIEESSVEEVSLKVREVMENIVSLKVPLKVNAAFGVNWELAHA